jgi:hypothetical protein
MAERSGKTRRNGRVSGNGRSTRACCLISEVLEEAGLDRRKARLLRRQLLEGLILLCRWQLERMDEAEASSGRSPRPRAAEARKVTVE